VPHNCNKLFLVGAIIALAMNRPTLADDAIEDALAATFRITDHKTSGTGFLVSAESGDNKQTTKPLLVTAAHVLEGFPAASCTLVLRANAADGSSVRKETSISIRDGDKVRWKRHPKLDIAAMRIELPEGTAAKLLTIRQLADETWAAERKIRVGKEVFIPCFPATLEANDAGWPVLRKGTIATHPLVPLRAAQTILIDSSAFGGDSGAPVVITENNDPVVVGLVIGMHRQTDKSVMPFEERTMHTPLGLSIAVQAPLIRETIDLALKEPAAQ